MCVSEGKAVMGPPRVLPSCNHTTSESDSKSKKPRDKSNKQKTKALQMKKQKKHLENQKTKKQNFQNHGWGDQAMAPINYLIN